MKLRLTRRALADLEAIVDYVHERNPKAALRVNEALQAGLQLVATYPHAGHERKRGVRSLALPRFPYLIFYRIDESASELIVLTIRHAARREMR